VGLVDREAETHASRHCTATLDRNSPKEFDMSSKKGASEPKPDAKKSERGGLSDKRGGLSDKELGDVSGGAGGGIHPSGGGPGG
jgi:hypothetical protein